MGHNIYPDSYSPPPQSRDLPRASQPVGRHWTPRHRWSVPLQPGLHALMNTLCPSLFVFCPNITQFSRNSLTNDSWQLINHYIVASSTITFEFHTAVVHLEAVPLRQSCLYPGLNFLFLLSFVSENIVTVHQSGGDHDLVMVDTSQLCGDRWPFLADSAKCEWTMF